MLLREYVVGTPLVSVAEQNRLLKASGEYTEAPSLLSSIRRDTSSSGHVFDEQGRRRFHGAFTGGFSAGYFNTVGSEEGWRSTKTFSSSRKHGNGANVQEPKTNFIQRPEDFLDDEDDANLSNSFYTSMGYGNTSNINRGISGENEVFAGLRNEFSSPKVNASANSDGLLNLVQPPEQSFGTKILESCGWRLGQGVGPRIMLTSDVSRAPIDTSIFRPCEISNFGGLGNEGGPNRDATIRTNIENLRGRMKIDGSDDEYVDVYDDVQSDIAVKRTWIDSETSALKSLTSRLNEEQKIENQVRSGDIFAGYRMALNIDPERKTYPCKVDLSISPTFCDHNIFSQEERMKLSKAAGSELSLASRFSSGTTSRRSIENDSGKTKTSETCFEDSYCQQNTAAIDVIRTVHSWKPEKLLCKRFGVQVPRCDKTSKITTEQNLSTKPLLSGLVGIRSLGVSGDNRDNPEITMEAFNDAQPTPELLKSIFEPSESKMEESNELREGMLVASKAAYPERVLFKPKFERGNKMSILPSLQSSQKQIKFDDSEAIDDTLPAWAQSKKKSKKRKTLRSDCKDDLQNSLTI